MENSFVRNKIIRIVKKHSSAVEDDADIPLTLAPYYFNAITLAAIFLEIEKQFNINLNALFEKPMNYSINALSDVVANLVS